ncbi:Zn-dependent hydrolase [Bacillus sp. ISL-40]|uniref:Zn-dependent hydrolase n=1 Tax=unclassified Bacillus (in: firmicutes) TaxID=185979 RepID=UPI001BE87D12|nr:MULTISPECIES: Zn-dependent hydrolase [unclassified Bacillus (in: firmicutes)]MBT2701139.1 Zn-dependent hydrolase [Bacillus sp. ISL-40]MBT2739100.1 Zn-dependent hydrolase [Bacillus sp. ISL-77]
MIFSNLKLSINSERLLNRLKELGRIGLDNDNKRTRLAASDADKAGRDQLVTWMKEAGLEIEIDRIGNIFGIWYGTGNRNEAPIMLGSHIDTVINAGMYDGCYGVLSGLEVINTLQEQGFIPIRPIAVAAFTNEEGVRYQPDMMGSLVYAGGLTVDDALKSAGTDGILLGEELERIGYSGTKEPGFLKPYAYIELHVEQGPILDKGGIPIGAVENLQGISWQRITIEGVANHAGTTPTDMRRDAGLAAARVITYLRDRANASDGQTVATVGTIEFKPNAVNVIPSLATFTVDLRNPNEQKLQEEEQALANYLKELAASEEVLITSEQLVHFNPVTFDQTIVKLVEQAASGRGLQSRRMTSGAGHDAQMMARICPAAMIFVPSIDGISHNPKEYTKDTDLAAGTNVLLDVVGNLAGTISKIIC